MGGNNQKKEKSYKRLADTSPRSFINVQKAIVLTETIDNAKIYPYKESTKYRCVDNNNIAKKENSTWT